MSEVTYMSRELLKKNVAWSWTPKHTDVLNKLKSLITNAPMLSNFNPKLSIVIQADASSSGVGCLLQ